VSEVNPLKGNPQLTPETLVSFVPMLAVKEEFGGADFSGVRPIEEVRKGYTQFRQGDILFAKITPCMENGKLGIVPPLMNGWGFGSTEFHVLRVSQEIETKWVAHFLSQEGFRREAQRHMTGSAGQLRVPASWLQQQTIPIAPTNEQRRIVQKIEELFSKLDAGVAALERIRAALKRYRAAVLKAAVEGKLTAEWRARHPSKETGAQLLRRILDERRRKWEQEQRAKYAKSGRQPPKGWQAKYKEPTEPDTSGLTALPEDWCWATVEQIAEVQGGIQKHPKRRPASHTFPFLRVANVLRGRLDLTEVHRIELFLIERWGRGTQKIIELCVQAGHPEPEFEERAGQVIVRFIPSGYTPPHRVSHDLTERQRRILHYLRDGQRRRIGQIMEGIGVTLPPSTLRDDLILLRSLGLVELLGSGRGAAWRLKNHPE
jgi:type I restriction enzyme, S subunit